jgi:hypothetical protein
MAIMGTMAIVAAQPRAAFAAISGAIYTTDCGNTVVNQNLYALKQDVYLSGGPNHPNSCSNGGLSPSGSYYFQVTDPSGKNLLSSDPLNCRVVHVSTGGVIDAYVPDASCTPATTIACGTPTDGPHNVTGAGNCGSTGKAAIQLFPFTDTPNNGGVYKMWIMPVDALPASCDATKVDPDADPDCAAASRHGFVTGNTKTDVFKVKPSGTPPPPPDLTGEIDVLKFCDANANGLLDNGEITPGIAGWLMTFSADPSSCTGLTDPLGMIICANLPADTYSVTEDHPAGFQQTASCLGGVCGTCTDNSTPCGSDLDCPANFTCTAAAPQQTETFPVAAGQVQELDFGNVGLSTVSGRKFDDPAKTGVDNANPGIAGVKILLDGTIANGSTLPEQCRITDVTGAYSFTGLLPGSYTVTEVKPAGTTATTSLTCPAVLAANTTPDLITGVITCGGVTDVCSFGNQCVGPGNGKTLGFWSNKNGQALITAANLTLLDGLNLVNANGSAFNPTTKVQVKNWLLSANATNMAYMLSAQLTAMELNVADGFVNGGLQVYVGTPPASCPIGVKNSIDASGFLSISTLMSDGNTMLGSTGGNLTLSGAPLRACEEFVKSALDAGNNNIIPVHCGSFNATCPL